MADFAVGEDPDILTIDIDDLDEMSDSLAAIIEDDVAIVQDSSDGVQQN